MFLPMVLWLMLFRNLRERSDTMALTPATWPRPLLNSIRVFNKHVLNPLMGRRAGRKHAYAAAIGHAGRKSGKQYSTPVGVDRVQDGFIIPLAYGTEVDWLQNVIAAGRATVLLDGETHEVTNPEVIDAATALPLLALSRRKTYQRIGIAHYLTVTVD